MIRVELWNMRSPVPPSDPELKVVPLSGADPTRLARGERDEEFDAVIWHEANCTAEGLTALARGRPKARVLVVTTGGPTAEHVATVKQQLPDDVGGRVFGAAQAGSKTTLEKNADFFRKVVAFLASREAVPDDAEVASFLGLDFPVRRLALRVALEIAREELSRPEPELEVQALLEPALKIAEGVTRLEQVVAPVRTVLQGTSEEVKAGVEQALKQLAGAEVQELRS
jgi:hypothetical protein